MKGGVLHVTAIEGKELAAKDSNGKSDPYLKVAIFGSKSKKVEQKSKVIEKTLEPKWNYKFNPFPYDNEDYSALSVNVFDKDLVGSDDFMGQVLIPIFEIKEGGGKFEKWYRLVTDVEGSFVSGSILLSFELLRDEDVDKKKKEEEKRKEKEKLEEQEKQLQILNEKKKELEKQRDNKINEMKLSSQLPISSTPSSSNLNQNVNRMGNAICVIDFFGQSQSELSMKNGDDLTIDDKSDPNWWYAKNHSSSTEGYIPASGGYVSFTSNNNFTPNNSGIGNARCAIAFYGQSQSELSMNVGDDLTIDDKSDPNWWYAKNHTSSTEGYIPASGGYVTFN